MLRFAVLPGPEWSKNGSRRHPDRAHRFRCRSRMWPYHSFTSMREAHDVERGECNDARLATRPRLLIM